MWTMAGIFTCLDIAISTIKKIDADEVYTPGRISETFLIIGRPTQNGLPTPK